MRVVSSFLCAVAVVACGQGVVGTASDPVAAELAASGPWAEWAPANPEPAGELMHFRVSGLNGSSYENRDSNPRASRRLVFVPQEADLSAALGAFSVLTVERADEATCARAYVPPDARTNEHGELEMSLAGDSGEREGEHRGMPIVVTEQWDQGGRGSRILAARRWDAPWCMHAARVDAEGPDPRDAVTRLDAQEVLATQPGRMEGPDGWKLLYDIHLQGPRVKDLATASFFDHPTMMETSGFLTIVHGDVTPLTYAHGGWDDRLLRRRGRGGADLLIREVRSGDALLFCTDEGQDGITIGGPPEPTLNGVEITWMERPNLLISVSLHAGLGCLHERDLMREALDLVEKLEPVSEGVWLEAYPPQGERPRRPRTSKAPSEDGAS